ncbi:hypothetical protein VitviT2T_016010 [Vitis vinifera]|uniref:Uncharacterized protein n=1 Tax=Vitis vinifera TaxID=29760 RepID=A0ABY9CRQ8_VITVI|nr:hypothetical protein VitviT2T_016010 [Vitis vinifera]
MSFRDENEDGRDLRKPFLHTGNWYRKGSRQSSMMRSSQVIRDSSVSIITCVLSSTTPGTREKKPKTGEKMGEEDQKG